MRGSLFLLRLYFQCLVLISRVRKKVWFRSKGEIFSCKYLAFGAEWKWFWTFKFELPQFQSLLSCKTTKYPFWKPLTWLVCRDPTKEYGSTFKTSFLISKYVLTPCHNFLYLIKNTSHLNLSTYSCFVPMNLRVQVIRTE